MPDHEFKRYTTDTAPEGSCELMKGIQGSYGFMPELFAYMAESPEVLEAYVTVNRLMSKTSLTPAQQQLVLLAISRKNECDFCQVAHEAMSMKNGLDKNTLSALKAGTAIADGKDAALVRLSQTIVEKRGWLENDDLGCILRCRLWPQTGDGGDSGCQSENTVQLHQSSDTPGTQSGVVEDA